jgi:thymidylate kinase
MEKNRMIIVEGPQGTGKTTLTNYLRDTIPGSNLYRLSGQKDKTLKGLESSKKMYFALLDYLKVMENVPMDLIFDRTFFTEEIYGLLGYKEYDFTDVYHTLVERLCSLNYDIYLILLYLEDTTLYRKRLDRGEHHNYQSFSIENSQNQQELYLEMGRKLENTNIHVVPLAMDNFEESYQKVNKIFYIK